MKVRVAVAGAYGRMGREIVKAIAQQDDLELALAVDVNGLGRDAGEAAGTDPLGVPITPPDGLSRALKTSGAGVLVDFTNPDAAITNARAAADAGVDLVIGTTGLKKEELSEIEELVKRRGISAVISPNMATGVNVFFRLVRDAAEALGDEYDVEIIEVHHRRKRDAPSGTALRTAALVAESLGRDVEPHTVFGRQGMVGERKKEEIGVHAVRAGDVVGDHTVLFAGDGERIEITHRAHSRQAFVKGVLKAIRFLAQRAGRGKTYSTWDVLGIK